MQVNCRAYIFLAKYCNSLDLNQSTVADFTFFSRSLSSLHFFLLLSFPSPFNFLSLPPNDPKSSRTLQQPRLKSWGLGSPQSPGRESPPRSWDTFMRYMVIFDDLARMFRLHRKYIGFKISPAFNVVSSSAMHSRIASGITSRCTSYTMPCSSGWFLVCNDASKEVV